MKKFCLIFILICLITLSGCKTLTAYREPEKVSIVSAIGFDNKDGKLNVCIETCLGENKKIYSIQGENAQKSIENINNSISNSLLLSHCGVISLSTNLSTEQISDILIYCRDNSEISLSVRIIATENSQKLINSDEKTILGYDILEFLENKKEDVDSPLYSVLSMAVNNGEFELPYINSSNNGYSTKQFQIKGVIL